MTEEVNKNKGDITFILEDQKRQDDVLDTLGDKTDSAHQRLDDLKNVPAQLNNIDVDIKNIGDKLKYLGDVDSQLTINLEKVEGQTKDHLERIIFLEEQGANQVEQVNYVNVLNARIQSMDEEKQKADAKLKEELDEKEKASSLMIVNLQGILDSKVGDLEGIVQRHEGDIGDLIDSQKAQDVEINKINVEVGDINTNIKALENDLTEKVMKNKGDITFLLEDQKRQDDAVDTLGDKLNVEVGDINKTIKGLKDDLQEEIAEAGELQKKVNISVGDNINFLNEDQKRQDANLGQLKSDFEKNITILNDISKDHDVKINNFAVFVDGYDNKVKEIADKEQESLKVELNELNIRLEGTQKDLTEEVNKNKGDIKFILEDQKRQDDVLDTLGDKTDSAHQRLDDLKDVPAKLNNIDIDIKNIGDKHKDLTEEVNKLAWNLK